MSGDLEYVPRAHAFVFQPDAVGRCEHADAKRWSLQRREDGAVHLGFCQALPYVSS